jgi:hypothetical protein
MVTVKSILDSYVSFIRLRSHKGKVVLVVYLTEHHDMKAYC